MTAVHQVLELGLGTGIIGQAQVGFPAAAALSAALDGAWFAAAMRRHPPERLLAYLAGVAIGVPVIHFTLWPWSTRAGVPLLTEAEGLPDEAMPLYNTILYAWGVAGATAAARETPRRHWPLTLAGFVSVIAFRRSAQQHFRWIQREAVDNPQWWNRAWNGPVDAHRAWPEDRSMSPK